MAFDVIKDIVSAEKEADAIKADAEAKARQIKADAVLKADGIKSQVKQNASAYEKTAVEAAINGAQAEVNKITLAAEEKCAQVKAQAQANRQKAIEAVIGKVVGINGDS